MYRYKSLQSGHYHERICLSCKFAEFYYRKYLKQDIDDDLSVCMDERSPCGLSITGDISL